MTNGRQQETVFRPAKKRCSTCGHIKPLTFKFWGKGNDLYGFNYRCRACSRQYDEVTRAAERLALRNREGAGEIFAALPKDEYGKPKPYWKWTEDESRAYDEVRRRQLDD